MPAKAKAGDPIFQRRQSSNPEAAAYWTPAFAGMTTVRLVTVVPNAMTDGAYFPLGALQL
jgi:hypothetical protein